MKHELSNCTATVLSVLGVSDRIVLYVVIYCIVSNVNGVRFSTVKLITLNK